MFITTSSCFWAGKDTVCGRIYRVQRSLRQLLGFFRPSLGSDSPYSVVPGASSLWAIVRLARVMIRFLMAGANAIRSKAYANHPLSEHLSAQMRSNMATQSKMLGYGRLLCLTSLDASFFRFLILSFGFLHDSSLAWWTFVDGTGGTLFGEKDLRPRGDPMPRMLMVAGILGGLPLGRSDRRTARPSEDRI